MNAADSFPCDSARHREQMGALGIRRRERCDHDFVRRRAFDDERLQIQRDQRVTVPRSVVLPRVGQVLASDDQPVRRRIDVGARDHELLFVPES